MFSDRVSKVVRLQWKSKGSEKCTVCIETILKSVSNVFLGESISNLCEDKFHVASSIIREEIVTLVPTLLSVYDIQSNLNYLHFFGSKHLCNFELALKSFKTDPFFTILCMFTLIERILRDVIYTKRELDSKKIEPSYLFTDLIVAEDVVTSVGVDMVHVLRVTMGPSCGMNLRNLYWHGFAVTKDFESSTSIYCFLVIHIFVVVCSRIESKLKSIGVSRLSAAPNFDLTAVKGFNISRNLPTLEIEVMSILNSMDSSLLKKSFCNPLLSEAFLLLHNNKWDELARFRFLVVTLPIIEQLLRNAYVEVNKLDNKMVLTANMNEKYIILDTILLPELSSGARNFLINFVGANCMDLMFDLFLSNFGPKLRDKISHGEIFYEDISNSIYSLYFLLIIYLMAILDYKFFISTTTIKDLMRSYYPQYHPYCLCLRNMEDSVLHLRENFITLKNIISINYQVSLMNEPNTTPFSYEENFYSNFFEITNHQFLEEEFMENLAILDSKFRLQKSSKFYVNTKILGYDSDSEGGLNKFHFENYTILVDTFKLDNDTSTYYLIECNFYVKTIKLYNTFKLLEESLISNTTRINEFVTENNFCLSSNAVTPNFTQGYKKKPLILLNRNEKILIIFLRVYFKLYQILEFLFLNLTLLTELPKEVDDTYLTKIPVKQQAIHDFDANFKIVIKRMEILNSKITSCLKVGKGLELPIIFKTEFVSKIQNLQFFFWK